MGCLLLGSPCSVDVGVGQNQSARNRTAGCPSFQLPGQAMYTFLLTRSHVEGSLVQVVSRPSELKSPSGESGAGLRALALARRHRAAGRPRGVERIGHPTRGPRMGGL